MLNGTAARQYGCRHGGRDTKACCHANQRESRVEAAQFAPLKRLDTLRRNKLASVRCLVIIFYPLVLFFCGQHKQNKCPCHNDVFRLYSTFGSGCFSILSASLYSAETDDVSVGISRGKWLILCAVQSHVKYCFMSAALPFHPTTNRLCG